VVIILLNCTIICSINRFYCPQSVAIAEAHQVSQLQEKHTALLAGNANISMAVDYVKFTLLLNGNLPAL
jgi:hypothetical protein